MGYRHLLVAVDTAEDHGALLAKAKEFSQVFGSRLSVLCVMPPPPVDTLAGEGLIGMPILASGAVDTKWTDELRAELRSRLQVSCAPHGIADGDIHVITGSVENGILETAQRLDVDLVVIGHHPHSGFFSTLFPHVDQSVVSKAVCDVLAVVLPQR